MTCASKPMARSTRPIAPSGSPAFRPRPRAICIARGSTPCCYASRTTSLILAPIFDLMASWIMFMALVLGLARISSCHRHHGNRWLKNDRGDGKNCANFGSDRTCLRRFSGGRCSSLRTRLRLGRLSPPSPDVSHSTLQPPCRLLITRGPNLQAGTSGLQAKPPPECSAGRPARS